MAKSDAQIKELQRRLVRLSRLDGQLVRCSDGGWLMWPRYVRSPQPLVAALRAGSGLSAALLASCLQLDKSSQQLTPRWLAAAQRDLRALALDGDALARAVAAARRFRNLPQPTAAWLAERQQRVRELAAQLESATPPALPTADAMPPWLAAVAELLQMLRGPEQGARLHALWRSSLAAQPGRQARRRLLGFVDRVCGRVGGPPDTRAEEPALQAFLDGAARDARGLLGAPEKPMRLGRAQLRRLYRIVRAVVLWPAAADSAHPLPEDGAALGALADRRLLLRTLAEPLLAGLSHRQPPSYFDRLAQTLSHYALLFPLDPGGSAISPLELPWLEQQLDRAASELAPHSLTLSQAMGLLRLPDAERGLSRLAQHVAAGVPVALLARSCELGYGAQLREFAGETAALRAYCEWVCQLAPLYQRLGQKLELSPGVSSRFAALREPSLSFLLHCLLASSKGSATPEVERELTLLDAALGLCQRAPQRAAELRGLLSSWPSGVGRARFPEFAAWLAEDALLDRYLHLAALAGEPAELSRTLLRDFAQAERLLRQQSFLSALKAPTSEQAQRLRSVEQALSASALPGPGWTRRRLSERADELQGRALRRLLDSALRDVLRQGLGVAPAEMTPAWRDAVRFYLMTQRNQDHLGTLLRFAAAHPGSSPARVFPKNQQWLRRASAHLDTAAWLLPRRCELVLDGQRYVLSSEEDPIEVLRMGIPFDTCLSLEKGINAASTVLNAMDANKRVLYLRDARGVIVGRKLLAISAQWGLLGYELYLSLAASLKPLVAAEVLALCQKLAVETRAPLCDSGQPETIHEGFWYDDGTQSFVPEESPLAAASGDVLAYCRSLEQPVPVPATANLAQEAALWRARSADSVEVGLKLLRPWIQWLANQELGAWLIEQMGLPQAERRARELDDLQPFVLDRLAIDQPERILAVAGTWKDLDGYYVRQSLYAAEPSPQLAMAMIEAGERSRRRRESPDDHGLCHLTFTDLEESLTLLPVGDILALCERLEVLWDWFVELRTHCEPCREIGIASVRRAAWISYSRQPDPRRVLACLRSRRHGSLAQSTALELASSFVLDEEAAPVSWPRPVVPSAGSREGLRAVQALGARRSELNAEPEYLAALLRQAGQQRVELPVPSCAPFEALANLLLVPQVRQRIAELDAPWARAPADLSTRRNAPWSGAWELYYHRRVQTPLRKRMAQLVLSESVPIAERSPLPGWLAELGDVETLTVLSARLNQGARSHHARAALEHARAVAWQVQLDTYDFAAELPALRAPPTSAHLVDPELLRRALSLVERTLQRGIAAESEYGWVLLVLRVAELPTRSACELVQKIVAARRGVLSEAELSVVRWFLQTRISYEAPELTDELLLDLWQVPGLRPHIATALGNRSQWPLRHRRLLRVAARTGQSIDGLPEQLLAATIERDVDTAVGAITTQQELQFLLRVAFAQLTPAGWLSIYKALCGYAEAACFLTELRRKTKSPAEIESLEQLCSQDSPHDPDEKVRMGWLRAALAQWRGATSE